MNKWIAGIKEFIRKQLVALKRKPQTIALVMLVIAFGYYSLNMTNVSDTTAYIQGMGMGLSGFVIMLFSLLSMVCFLNAFPRRKKVNIPMLLLMFVMLGGMIGCSFYYESQIDKKIVDTRRQFLVAAQTNVLNAMNGAQEAPKAVTAAQKSVEAIEKTIQTIDEKKAAIEAAIAATTKDQAVCEAAIKNVDKAIEDAAAALKSAQSALEKATASAEEATQKAEAAPISETIDALNAAARSAVNAANTAQTSANTAAAAVDKANAALEKAEAALATVDVWTAVTHMQADIDSMKKQASATAAPAAAAAAPTNANSVMAAEIELPQSVIDEAMAQGEQKVDELLTDTVDQQIVPSSISLAKDIMSVHRIMLIVAMALTALLPVYAPLLRKIRTSIEVEANENMGEIELNGSDE